MRGKLKPELGLTLPSIETRNQGSMKLKIKTDIQLPCTRLASKNVQLMFVDRMTRFILQPLWSEIDPHLTSGLSIKLNT